MRAPFRWKQTQQEKYEREKKTHTTSWLNTQSSFQLLHKSSGERPSRPLAPPTPCSETGFLFFDFLAITRSPRAEISFERHTIIERDDLHSIDVVRWRRQSPAMTRNTELWNQVANFRCGQNKMRSKRTAEKNTPNRTKPFNLWASAMAARVCVYGQFRLCAPITIAASSITLVSSPEAALRFTYGSQHF